MAIFSSKFYTVLGAFAVFMMSVSTAGASDVASPAKKTINIGIYAQFSEKSAFIGRNILGAMEIAREQLASSDIHYEFYTLDTLTNKANASNTLQKFIDVNQINVLVTEGADSDALIAPLAKKNGLIHFCMGNDAAIADGKNNFLAQSPNHQRAANLTTVMNPEFVAQFKQDYSSYPVTEAGYAFDIFQLVHHSALMAMKTDSHFSSQAMATHLLALESGTGVMGTYSVSKKGVSYKKEILTA